MNRKIVLGSQSPRRLEILQDANFDVEVVIPKVAEDIPENMAIHEAPIYLSKIKMLDVYNYIGNDDHFIITADTLLIFENKLIGKPANNIDGLKILMALNGNMHEVISGVTIRKNKKEISFSETTKVYFKNLTQKAIENFISQNNILDKAGAYNIQEYIGVAKFEGDYTNVIGLPIKKVITTINNWNTLV